MKFIVDAQMPPQLAAWLRAKGHDAAAVREIGLREALDPDIWSRAERDGAIIVTKDEDFAELAGRTTEGPQVLWVRAGNLVNRVLIERFENAWPQAEPLLAEGARLVEIR